MSIAFGVTIGIFIALGLILFNITANCRRNFCPDHCGSICIYLCRYTILAVSLPAGRSRGGRDGEFQPLLKAYERSILAIQHNAHGLWTNQFIRPYSVWPWADCDNSSYFDRHRSLLPGNYRPTHLRPHGHCIKTSRRLCLIPRRTCLTLRNSGSLRITRAQFPGFGSGLFFHVKYSAICIAIRPEFNVVLIWDDRVKDLSGLRMGWTKTLSCLELKRRGRERCGSLAACQKT